MPDIDYAAKVRELYPYANDLARAVGVAYPLNDDSPGAKWLYQVREYYADDWESILEADYPQDELEFTEGGGECNTYTQWLIFADLQLWQYDADATYSTQAEFPTRNWSTEKALAIKVEDIPELAERLMEEIANTLQGIILSDLQKAVEDAADDSEDEDGNTLIAGVLYGPDGHEAEPTEEDE